jgi:hypothetical protein
LPKNPSVGPSQPTTTFILQSLRSFFHTLVPLKSWTSWVISPTFVSNPWECISPLKKWLFYVHTLVILPNLNEPR